MTVAAHAPHLEAEKLLKQGLIDAAYHAAQDSLQQHPNHADLYYILAVCCRYREAIADAFAALQQLARLKPNYARQFQESGHCYLAMNNPNAARYQFEQAVQYNPALIASWQHLVDLSHTEAKQQAQSQLQYWQSLPRELLSAYSMFYEGKLRKSEQLCRHYMQRHPKQVQGMKLLGLLASQLGVMEEAEFLLESAVVLEPENLSLCYELVLILNKRQKFAQAHQQAQKLYNQAPDNPSFIILYANQLQAIGELQQAITFYREAMAQLPAQPQLHLVLGHALKTQGEQEQAVQAYQKACALQPSFGEAWWSLANLKTYRFSAKEIALMQQQTQEAIPHSDKYHLCFALGKALEDQKDVTQSFQFYQQGNQLKHREVGYTQAQYQAEVDAQIAFFTPTRAQALANLGHPDPAPIFILGLPRAGSTLLEQILASHSQIDGTLELPNVLSTVARLSGKKYKSDASRYPEVLAQLSPAQLQSLGEQYIENTAVHRGSAPYFIDKMPNNFRHIGLIKSMLPNAKIIDARRLPLDCGFSLYKQLFAEGQEFSYDLTDIKHYYQQYLRLMDHWQQCYPNDIKLVHHEAVVDDFESQVRGLLAFLDLPFEEACLSFHLTDRAVRTASSEQVRQPVNRSGMNRWQPYEQWLTPLTEVFLAQ